MTQTSRPVTQPVPQTFVEALTQQLRHEPGRPFITFYDDATGERVELSVTTYANWVAKAAGLLTEECDLEKGDTLRIDLPSHWLAPVFLGAAWTVGLVLTWSDTPDAVVCGPASLERWAPQAQDRAVLACSLLPLGVRFATPVPAGVRDVGVEIWSQPDGFTAWDPAAGSDVALAADGAPLSQAEMLEAATTGSLLAGGGRLMSVQNPASPPGIGTFIAPLVTSGSLVLVTNAGPARLDEIAAAERVTTRA